MLTVTEKQLKTLEQGDVVRHVASGESFVVIIGACGKRPAIGIRQVSISNPAEWTLVKKHDWSL